MMIDPGQRWPTEAERVLPSNSRQEAKDRFYMAVLERSAAKRSQNTSCMTPRLIVAIEV